MQRAVTGATPDTKNTGSNTLVQGDKILCSDEWQSRSIYAVHRCVPRVAWSRVLLFCLGQDKADPVERFDSSWDAYSKLAEQLVVASLHSDQLMSLMADNYSTPDSVLFEEELRMRVNRRLHRLAVVSVCRLDSRSSDGLQLADLLTSAVTYEFRATAGIAAGNNPKAQLAAHVRSRLGTASCLGGWRNARHSVAEYSHGSWLPGTAS